MYIDATPKDWNKIGEKKRNRAKNINREKKNDRFLPFEMLFFLFPKMTKRYAPWGHNQNMKVVVTAYTEYTMLDTKEMSDSSSYHRMH